MLGNLVFCLSVHHCGQNDQVISNHIFFYIYWCITFITISQTSWNIGLVECWKMASFFEKLILVLLIRSNTVFLSKKKMWISLCFGNLIWFWKSGPRHLCHLEQIICIIHNRIDKDERKKKYGRCIIILCCPLMLSYVHNFSGNRKLINVHLACLLG